MSARSTRRRFDGVKVFSATMINDRQRLGEVVTEWLQRQSIDVVDISITQSSDASFHCITVVVFYAAR